MRRTILFKKYNSFLVILFAFFFSPAVPAFLYLINQNTHILYISDEFLSNILTTKKIHFDFYILLCIPYLLDLFIFFKYTKIDIFYCFMFPSLLYIFHAYIFIFYFNILESYNLIH